MRLTHERFLERQNDIVLKLAELYGEVVHLKNTADFSLHKDYLYIKRLSEGLEKLISNTN